MRILAVVIFLLVAMGCDEFGDREARKLSRIEFHSYDGSILNVEYNYDNRGRITTITTYQDDKDPVVAQTITYEGNKAILHPTFVSDPAINHQTTIIELTLDGNGLTQKRTEYRHGVYTSTTGVDPPELFFYDTLIFEYNASGLLTSTTGSRYDSTWINPTQNSVRRMTSNATYTIESGNPKTSDEFFEYTTTTVEDGETDITGGSSEYHFEFNYSKSYPNKTDFTNMAIVNEQMQNMQDFEALLNINCKNMPDEIIRHNIDRDLDGAIVFNLERIKDIERTYNGAGLLASVSMPIGGVQYTEVNYFYR